MASPRTLNQIIQLFESIVSSSPQVIKRMYYGNPSGLLGIQNAQYPMIVIVPTNSEAGENTIKHTWRFAIADLVHKDETNLEEVHSDCLQLLCDWIRIFRYESDDYTLTNTPVLEPFAELWGDEVAGYAADLTLEFPFNNNYCDLPFGEFGFTGPTFDSTSLTGRSGTSGFSGYSGSGVSGYSGVNGIIGLDGSSGYSGYSGINGIQGRSGSSGFSGYSGSNGIGSNGNDGLSGYSGISGFSGQDGVIGSDGLSGYSGFSGRSGFSGKSGFSGTNGILGADGTSGYSGFSGIDGIGISGFSGISGYSGTNGTVGTSGFSGYSGYSGTSGFSGYSGTGTSGFSGISGVNANSAAFFMTWDGQGGFVTTGNTRYLIATAACTITGWNIVATGTSPTATFDIWKIASGTTLPTVSNSIMGTKPAIATGNALRSTTLTSWTTLAIAAGDILAYNIDSLANATTIRFNLETI